MMDEVNKSEWERQRESLEWPSPYEDELLGLNLHLKQEVRNEIG